MKRFAKFLVPTLAVVALSAETRLPEFDHEPQPGLLRVSGASDTDKVFLDDELIADGKRLHRFGSKLFVSPGQYTVTIVDEENNVACRSRVTIRESATSVARCPGVTAGSQEVD